MITVRKSNERGKNLLDWLLSYHTFSFGHYYDPAFMGFSSLRVINEDWIAPTKGFGTHAHDNMEILTYVVSGRLAHKDTLNTQAEIQAGEVQLMSAGTRIAHSEFNPSADEKVHLLQIWILPDQKGLTPGYQQKNFQAHTQGLKLIASPDGKDGSLTIHQDARIYLGKFKQNESLSHPASKRHLWLQMIQETATVNGITLNPGDGAAISGEKAISIEAAPNAEFLLFDLV